MFEKKGVFSFLKDMLPKHESSENPFATPTDDDDNKEGCIEGCLAKLAGFGPIGCIMLATGGAGIFTVLFGG